MTQLRSSKSNNFKGSLLYLYKEFRGYELGRFDGPACGTSLDVPSLRDGVDEAAADYRAESGSESEKEPDEFCSVTRHARGVDVHLVSFVSIQIKFQKSKFQNHKKNHDSF